MMLKFWALGTSETIKKPNQHYKLFSYKSTNPTPCVSQPLRRVLYHTCCTLAVALFTAVSRFVDPAHLLNQYREFLCLAALC